MSPSSRNLTVATGSCACKQLSSSPLGDVKQALVIRVFTYVMSLLSVTTQLMPELQLSCIEMSCASSHPRLQSLVSLFILYVLLLTCPLFIVVAFLGRLPKVDLII